MNIKVAIGCCNVIFTEAVKRVLSKEKDIKVIKTFKRMKTLGSSLKELGDVNADVIVMDMDRDFITSISLFEDPPVKRRYRLLLLGDKSILNITDYQVSELLAKGVAGIVPHSSDKGVLKDAIRTIYNGELWMEGNLLVKVMTSLKNRKTGRTRLLAKKERQILYHICQGYKNKEIAQKLKINEQTVKTHCNRIYKKLGVTDKLQLVLYTKNFLKTEN